MKRLFFFFATIICIIACTDNNPDNNENNTTPKPAADEIKIDITSLNFDKDGGQKKISFNTNKDWTAEIINDRADSWCNISPSSGSAGDATVSITTTQNDSSDDRTASIILKAGIARKTITVSQKQKDALTITASQFELDAEGGEVVVEVKANVDFTCEIEESAKNWVIHRSTRAMKTSTLTFEIKKNDDTTKRNANITISSGNLLETVTIYQECGQ